MAPYNAIPVRRPAGVLCLTENQSWEAQYLIGIQIAQSTERAKKQSCPEDHLPREKNPGEVRFNSFQTDTKQSEFGIIIKMS